MLPQVLKILKIPPAQLTDQVTCARIIEPRQRSRHFCCHRTFMCWHSLRSCSVQGMVPWSMLPFLSTDSPPTKNGTAFRRLSLSAERKLLYSGHCETSTSLSCHALSQTTRRRASQGRNSSWLASDSLVRASECSSWPNPTGSVVGCHRHQHLSSAPTPFHEAPFQGKAPK